MGRARGLESCVGTDKEGGGDKIMEGDLDPHDKNPRQRQSGHLHSIERNGGTKYHQGNWSYPSKAMMSKGQGIR